MKNGEVPLVEVRGTGYGVRKEVLSPLTEGKDLYEDSWLNWTHNSLHLYGTWTRTLPAAGQYFAGDCREKEDQISELCDLLGIE